jgi:hypothetical protein
MDIDDNDSLVEGPLWIILERRSVTPDPEEGAVHAGDHSRALCGLAGDVRYLAAFTSKAQAERLVAAGSRRDALLPAALETTEQMAEFLEHAERAGHAHLGFDREADGPPARLIAVHDLLGAARQKLSRRKGPPGAALRPAQGPSSGRAGREEGEGEGAAVAEPESRLPRGPKAWRYTAQGWSLIDNPLHGAGEAESPAEVLRRAGYLPQASLRLEGGSRWASDCRLEVYDGKEPDHFLVCVSTRGPGYPILVVGLGQLLDLLGKLLPVVELGGRARDKELNLLRQAEPTEGLP